MALRHCRSGVPGWHTGYRSPLLLGGRTGILAPNRRFLQRAGTAALLGMAMYAYFAMRRAGVSHPNSLAVHWTIGSAVFTVFGAGLLGFAHTWPSVNKWTHGTLITAMHGHGAFYGAYAMIVMAVISYALPHLTSGRKVEGTSVGYWAFWLQVMGMFGMTLSFGTAGIGQVYLERILGLGYLDAQLKLQVHFLMLIATASLFATGAALFIWNFFRTPPKPVEGPESETAQSLTVPREQWRAS